MAEDKRPKPNEPPTYVPPEPPPEVEQTWRGGASAAVNEYVRGTAFRAAPPIATKAEVEAGHRVVGVGEPETALDMTGSAQTHTPMPAQHKANISDRYKSVTKDDIERGWITPKKA